MRSGVITVTLAMSMPICWPKGGLRRLCDNVEGDAASDVKILQSFYLRPGGGCGDGRSAYGKKNNFFVEILLLFV